MKWKSLLALTLGLSSLVLLVAGCRATAEPCPDVACPEAGCAPCPTAEPCADVEAPKPACPEVAACPETEPPPAVGASQYQLSWVRSAHADVKAEAFTHWDEDDPPVVPSDCAKCHSEGGFLDFLGMDGTEARVVNNDAETGTTITCDACHNDATASWDAVVFPSDAEISALGAEARCMECHQGRASTFTVDDSIAAAGVADMDSVGADLLFTNIHYYAAAASMYGNSAKGGYEYEGKAYDARHDHVPGMDTCLDCHDSHTLEVRVEKCGTCHPGVADLEDLRNNRMMGSLVDYDGDGDIEEGIYYEIEGLRDLLYQAIQAYASQVSASPIAYDSDAYPYFFVDTNANGDVDESEAAYENQYNAWTGRLAKAAYNYQTSVKDPGAYAHGPKYIIQLLYDSIEDLNQALALPVDLSAAHRIDHRHFAGSEPAFRNWDNDGLVPRYCSRCHTAGGLPIYITEGASVSQPPSNGLNCATCHDSLPEFTVYQVPWVRFPRGALIDSGDPNTNLCLNCHQGLSSIATVNAAIAGRDLDTPSEELEFISIHNLVAGATVYGTEVQGAYEYGGKDYAGRLQHVEAYSNCADCHNIHRQEVKAEECGLCHAEVATLEDLVEIRIQENAIDFDGDGDTSEGISGEIETMRDALYAAIQNYAASVADTPIVYQAQTSPYFFVDRNSNGVADPTEVNDENRYASWTPRLVRATYNYHYAVRDPGAFAHNSDYVLQVLYDSLEDLGGDLEGVVRP